MTEEIKNENLQNNLQQNNQTNNTPKPRMHSYNAGLPKNFRKKLEQKNQANKNAQNNQQNAVFNSNNQSFMANDGPNIKITDINSRTLNRVIGLNQKVRHNKNSLKIMFLGGVGEIGKNMMALEYGNDIIIIDCGATFPYTEAMPGIDLVVPDVTYLIQNKNKIRAMLITHGHEDHIGAIPYVVGDINVPIYGSKLAVALMQNKLKEFPKLHAKFVTVKPRDIVHLGAFTVEFINVCHSIAGTCWHNGSHW